MCEGRVEAAGGLVTASMSPVDPGGGPRGEVSGASEVLRCFKTQL